MTQNSENEPVRHPLHDNPWFKKMQAINESRESGKINQAEYERKHRGLMVELQSAANKGREKIKSWAISSKKVRDEAEYKRLCAHYHDAYGDSFHHFLTSIHAGASFLTMNEKMLDDARLLELRFGGKILSPEQAVAESEREKAEEEKAANEAEE
ncbi:MAG: hypothetical protein ACRYFS_02840 [Janthinobacterium lividum]